jgi:hypothetical protein
MFKSFKSFRFWASILCIVAALPLAFFVYQYWEFTRWAAERARDGGVCGTGVIALLAVCAIANCITAGVAGVLAIIGYLKREEPRSALRSLEKTAIGTYAASAFALMGSLFLR